MHIHITHTHTGCYVIDSTYTSGQITILLRKLNRKDRIKFFHTRLYFREK